MTRNKRKARIVRAIEEKEPEHDNGEGVPFDVLASVIAETFPDSETAYQELNELVREGRIYEPVDGKFRTTGGGEKK